MRISELGRRAGVSARALRHYEEPRLLPARRRANGHHTNVHHANGYRANSYRDYDEHDVRVVAEIRSLVDLGFALEETRPFVECLRAGPPTGSRCPAAPVVHRRKLADLMIVIVTDATFDDVVLRAARPVLVDFRADWRPPCV